MYTYKIYRVEFSFLPSARYFRSIVLRAKIYPEYNGSTKRVDDWQEFQGNRAGPRRKDAKFWPENLYIHTYTSITNTYHTNLPFFLFFFLPVHSGRSRRTKINRGAGRIVGKGWGEGARISTTKFEARAQNSERGMAAWRGCNVNVTSCGQFFDIGEA